MIVSSGTSFFVTFVRGLDLNLWSSIMVSIGGELVNAEEGEEEDEEEDEDDEEDDEDADGKAEVAGLLAVRRSDAASSASMSS
jgi:hypothetical protein